MENRDRSDPNVVNFRRPRSTAPSPVEIGVAFVYRILNGEIREAGEIARYAGGLMDGTIQQPRKYPQRPKEGIIIPINRSSQ